MNRRPFSTLALIASTYVLCADTCPEPLPWTPVVGGFVVGEEDETLPVPELVSVKVQWGRTGEGCGGGACESCFHSYILRFKNPSSDLLISSGDCLGYAGGLVLPLTIEGDEAVGIDRSRIATDTLCFAFLMPDGRRSPSLRLNPSISPLFAEDNFLKTEPYRPTCLIPSQLY
jgi:hypothetical protein